MKFKVTNKIVDNSGITYDLAHGGTPAGTVRVNYGERTLWKAQGIDGLLIADESTRRAMYKAVRLSDAT